MDYVIYPTIPEFKELQETGIALGTKMASVQPSNNSELQLYRVLQRANLLQYFETFITQGKQMQQFYCMTVGE